MNTSATLASPAPPKLLTAYRPYWAKRFGTAPFLPMSRAEMEALGWDACDIDVADEHQVAALLETARHRFGRLDCAFNNAGVNGRAALLEDMDLAEWQRTLAVNLSGVFLCLKHELRLMQTQGHGAIVNNASGGGLIAVPQMAAYCASKHGVLGLTKTAAQENARRGIRVNAVLPGSTDTPMLRAAMGGSADAERMILASVPGGRLGRPEEVAEAVAWLCSDRASYVSGESLLVDMATVAR